MGPPRAPLATAAFCTAVALRGAVVRASPDDLFGLGPRSSAMAGTGESIAQDYGAVYSNPAGLSRVRARLLTLGYVGALYELYTARGAAAAEHAPVDRARALQMAIVLPIPLAGVARDRVALGDARHLPTDLLLRNRILRPETPQFLVLEHRAQTISLEAGVGVDLGRGLRVGVGGSALAALSGNVTVLQDASGTLAYRVDDRLVASYAALAGASWEWRWLRVGVAARTARVAQIRVQIEARNLGLTLPVFNIAGLSQYDPAQVALELGYVRGPWTLALGATYKLWSDYPGPLEATTSSSAAPPPPGFGNTLTARLGLEHRWSLREASVALRGGYFYEPTPVPLATGASNYLDNDRHGLTAGLGLGARALGTTLTLDLFAQAHLLAERSAAKDPAVGADNPGAPAVRHGGAVYLVGFTATVSL